MKSQENIKRRFLPHWFVPHAAHFITYRLAGTIPRTVISELQNKKQSLLKMNQDRETVHKKLFVAYEKFLDKQNDIDWLRDPRVASVLRENLYHHDGTKYTLHAYCVMPNHVHVLLTPTTEVQRDPNHQPVGEMDDTTSPLSEIMHSLKSYTANQANKTLNRSGRFWQPESYDHWVRDADEFERIVNYIRANPVQAKLVSRHEEWFWSSCHDRFMIDGDTCGWLLRKEHVES